MFDDELYVNVTSIHQVLEANFQSKEILMLVTKHIKLIIVQLIVDGNNSTINN